MGALVTLKLPDSSSADLPWIVTFGPLDEYEDWEPVVCGPYERPHALALAEAVVADEELLAVVEPLLPRVSPGEIRHEIAEAQRQAADATTAGAEAYDLDDGVDGGPRGPGSDGAGPDGAQSDGAQPDGGDFADPGNGSATGYQRPPDAEEVRAGFARIAARLTGF